MVDHGLCHGCIEYVAEVLVVVVDIGAESLAGVRVVCTVERVVDVRIGEIVVLSGHEEEELVLDDRTADGETVGLGHLLLVLCAVLDIGSRGGTDEILVEEVGICRTLEGVGTRLGDGVDRTSGETGLTDVERSDYNLDFLNRVKRDRVGACLASVGT